MRIARRLVPVLVAAALSGSAWGQCMPKVPPASLVQPGKLQLAINPTLPPQQFVDERGELQGLDGSWASASAWRCCRDRLGGTEPWPG